VRANPSLQRNPDLVVEGRKYKVPASVDAPAAPAAPALVRVDGARGGASDIPDTVPVVRRTTPVPVTELVDALPAAPAPRDGGGTRVYVVKENDNLWRIAAEQLGSGNAWVQIKALNKDVLKDGEGVLPNMRLRLPARSVSSAAD
jgi:nucleoid-associated protein YgaU